MHLNINDLLDLRETIAKDIFENVTYAWEVLPHIKEFITILGKSLPKDEYDEVSENIWIAKNAKVMASAFIAPNTIIDKGAEIRHCAFIRGNVIVGSNSVVGNSTEIKNSILFNKVQVPHYNYIGDSILGHKVHMGASSLTSNVKSDKSLVTVRIGETKIETGLKKFGAIVGDSVEVGCLAVLNPGSVIGRNSNIYPLSSVRGFVSDNSILKSNDIIVKKHHQTESR